MPKTKLFTSKTFFTDLLAGVVVFLVALPLCLGIAKASGDVPLISGIIAGILGGTIVAIISRSHTSVSGPAAGLTAVVAAQVTNLGTFEVFLVAVFLAGIIQIVLGILKAGALSEFFPNSVIKGLLAAIGIIIIMKMAPHLVGHDQDALGEMSFNQPDKENTFTEIVRVLDDFHMGAGIIGISSVLFLLVWDRIKLLKKSGIPSAIIVVLFGVLLNYLFTMFSNKDFIVSGNHLVEIPEVNGISNIHQLLNFPDFNVFMNLKMLPDLLVASFVIAIVASLETLLNCEAVDKLDPLQRTTPTSRELVAQGCGNMVSGLIGGLPITSVVIRSTVNINSGGRTKISAIFHGIILLMTVVLIPFVLNMIPISCLAAILILTGCKLASLSLFKRMISEGPYQYLPFFGDCNRYCNDRPAPGNYFWYARCPYFHPL